MDESPLMARSQPTSSRELPGVAYVGLGILLGAAYVAFDLWAEAKLEHGTLTGALGSTHAVVDHLLPLLSGALLGVCVYQLRLRKRLHAAEEAASRAEALRSRLSRIERDQAVWILAASVLHELNNPLHALGLLLDEQAASDDDPARRAELGARARAQMNRILSPLSALRTLRTGADPDIQDVALERLVKSVADELSALVVQSPVQVEVECEAPLQANVDPSYVRTILENLLDNSLHALSASGGGNVTIRLYAEGSRAVVEVTDDGPELSEETRATLFDPLRSTKSHGLGLGLPIARALARALDGELALDSRLRKAFRLELPREMEP
jgi:signal transduction histidine kinase